jgi:hypothetical protein
MSPKTGVTNRWFPNEATHSDANRSCHRRKLGQGTRGTETSKYPEEYKSYEIP